jgi:hypothetical protein
VAATGSNPVHCYSSTGTFDVRLVVNDGTVDSDPVFTTMTVSGGGGGGGGGGGHGGGTCP